MLFGFWRTAQEHVRADWKSFSVGKYLHRWTQPHYHSTRIHGLQSSTVKPTFRDNRKLLSQGGSKGWMQTSKKLHEKIHFLKQKKIDSFDFIWNYNYLLKFELNKELLFCVRLSNWRPTVEEELAFSFSPSLDLLNFINSFIDRCIYIFILSVMHLLKIWVYESLIV